MPSGASYEEPHSCCSRSDTHDDTNEGHRLAIEMMS
jgi:hypothetical protein